MKWLIIVPISIAVILAVAFVQTPPDPIAAFQPKVEWGIDFVTDEQGFPYRVACYATKDLTLSECEPRFDRMYRSWKKTPLTEGDVTYSRKTRHAQDWIRVTSRKGVVKGIEYFHELTPLEVGSAWAKNGFRRPYIHSSSITWP